MKAPGSIVLRGHSFEKSRGLSAWKRSWSAAPGDEQWSHPGRLEYLPRVMSD